MSKLLDELSRADSWEEVRAQFGELLNLDGPAPSAVVRRALEDDLFTHYLIVTRDDPKLLRVLLEDPRNQEYEQPVPEEESSAADLLTRAAGALIRWGKAGFVQVDPATLERRWGACQTCPNLVAPPDRVLYRMVQVTRGDHRICVRCGCVASRKAKLPTERCPERDPDKPSLSRWGDPFEAEPL